MRATSFVILVSLLAAGCGPEEATQDASRPAPAAPVAATRPPAELPAKVTILPDSAALRAVSQCSRAVPPDVTGTWTPTVEQVAHADSLLPAFLAPRDEEPGRKLADHARQYAGIVSRGRRVLYLNAFPYEHPRPSDYDWRVDPLVVCDGGAAFFGAEYDVEQGRFTGVEFNGSAG